MAQRQTREDQRKLINSFGNCAVGSAEVHQMVVDESFIKYCSVTTRVESKEQYMEANHDNMLPIITEHLDVIAKEENLIERDRDRMYPNALEKEVPEKGATDTVGNPIILMAATKNTARVFVPKSGTCAPMIAHCSDMSKRDCECKLLRNERVHVDQTNDIVPTGRISKKDGQLPLKECGNVKGSATGE